MNMVAAGYTFTRSTLQEFKGEPWADEALQAAPEAGK